MGAAGHMRGADSAFLFVMAATDDKLTPKKLDKKLQKTHYVSLTQCIFMWSIQRLLRR